MSIKSYRGLLTDDDQIKIRLKTKTGMTGYRIKKFQVMPFDIDGSSSHECSVCIWKVKQATVSNDVDFTQGSLLASAYYVRSLNPSAPYVALISEQSVVFDNEVFNQDIFVSYQSGQSGQKINYYIELEQLKLSDTEQAMAILKSMRTSYGNTMV